jgi:hypothetical protein
VKQFTPSSGLSFRVAAAAEGLHVDDHAVGAEEQGGETKAEVRIVRPAGGDASHAIEPART